MKVKNDASTDKPVPEVIYKNDVFRLFEGQLN